MDVVLFRIAPRSSARAPRSCRRNRATMRAERSSWTAKKLDAWRSRLYVSDQSCAPVWVSTSWALTRMAEPPMRTLPSSTYRAPSLAPSARSFPASPFRRAAEALRRPTDIETATGRSRSRRTARRPAPRGRRRRRPLERQHRDPEALAGALRSRVDRCRGARGQGRCGPDGRRAGGHAAQSVAQLLRRREPFGEVLLEAALDHPPQRPRAGRPAGRPTDGGVSRRIDETSSAEDCPGTAAAGRHLVEDDAEREEVGPVIQRPALDLLRDM